MLQSAVLWTRNKLKASSGLPEMPGFQNVLKASEEAYAFHSRLADYATTPLVRLDGCAARLGLGRIWVKDESKRFGLNAFKGLGGSFAVTRLLERMKCQASWEGHGQVTFITATDGNHGRGIAWAARTMGQRAVVFMPKGSSPARVKAIEQEGAKVTVTEVNYDETVRIASDHANATGGVLVQDQAWEGYVDVPRLIMEGYLTIMHEITCQLRKAKESMPTHVLLQAGVGSFAGSMAAYLEELKGSRMPWIGIIEPRNADCLFRSALAADGTIKTVGGSLETIMAGLSCGEPNPIAWGILRRTADCFFSCEDSVTELGMRTLGRPCPPDPAIISGESGAVGIGLIEVLMSEPGFRKARETAGLGPGSSVLAISTEGDTDPGKYLEILGNR